MGTIKAFHNGKFERYTSCSYSFIFFFIILIIELNIFAQVTEEWVARYNGPGNYDDNANVIALDSSGNVYVTGESYGSETDFDYATIKYNSVGIQRWIARYNGPGNGFDQAYAIAVDSSGNVYVTGESYGSRTNLDYATIKYDSLGIQQWVSRYNGPGDYVDNAYAIAVDSSGNVYVTGYSYGSGTFSDYATIKYNSSGIEQWVARYNGPGNDNDRAWAIALDNSGNVYVTGYSIGLGTDYGYATIKYNSSGVQQWVARYNGPGNGFDQAYAIAVDSSGNVYVTGLSEGDLGNERDYATIKYNSSGVEQWVARYNGPGNGYDEAYAIDVDSSGNVYVTGFSDGSGTYPFNYDYATIKYNSSGVEQWVARYNCTGNGGDAAYAIALDSSGNVYVTGLSDGSGTYPFNYGYATIKYNSSGVQQWVARYNGPGNGDDYARAITVDSSGNVYVTGLSDGSGTAQDYATIKYSQGISNANPTITIINPPAIGANASDKYLIKWSDEDPDDNALISLYYDTDNQGYNGTLINTESVIDEDDETDSYEWNLYFIPAGTYYIYAKIDDTHNPPVYSNYSGPLNVFKVQVNFTLSNLLPIPQEIIVGDESKEDDTVMVCVSIGSYSGSYLLSVIETVQDTGDGSIHNEFEYEKTHQVYKPFEAWHYIKIPALPVYNNSVHNVKVIIKFSDSNVFNQTFQYKVMPYQPDMVVVTNINKLSNLFSINDFNYYDSAGEYQNGPCVLQLLQNACLDKGILSYSNTTDQEKVFEIREKINKLCQSFNGILFVFIVGSQDIVPMGKIVYGESKGEGDYPFWSETGTGYKANFMYSRLPTYSFFDPGDKKANIANYVVFKRFLEEEIGKTISLKASNQLYISADNGLEAGFANFYEHTQEIREKVALITLSYESSIHHTNNARHLWKSMDYDINFLKNVKFIYAKGHGNTWGVSDQEGLKYVLTHWANAHLNSRYWFWPYLRFHNTGQDFLSSNYIRIGCFQDETQEDVNIYNIYTFNNRPLAFVTACSTADGLGKYSVLTGLLCYTGFNFLAGNITSNWMASAFSDYLILTLTGKVPLSLLHKESCNTPITIFSDILTDISKDTKKGFVQFGYPKNYITALGDENSPVLSEDMLCKKEKESVPSTINIDITNYTIEDFEGAKYVNLEYKIDGEPYIAEKWILSGNPLLPVIEFSYNLGSNETISNVSFNGNSQFISKIDLYDVPGFYYGSLYEYYPIEDNILFDPPIRWSVQEISDNQMALTINVFPVQYYKDTTDTYVYDDISISINTSERNGGIISAIFDKDMYFVGDVVNINVNSEGGNLLRIFLDSKELESQIPTGNNTFQITTTELFIGNHNVDIKLLENDGLLDEISLSFNLLDEYLDFKNIVISQEVSLGNNIQATLTITNLSKVEVDAVIGVRINNNYSQKEVTLTNYHFLSQEEKTFNFEIPSDNLRAGYTSIEFLAKVNEKEYKSPLHYFWLIGNELPQITILEPDAGDNFALESYIIKWFDGDNDDNATISLYYDSDNQSYDGTLITEGISEDDSLNEYVWNLTNVEEGIYWIYGKIDDGKNLPVYEYSEGTVNVIKQPELVSVKLLDCSDSSEIVTDSQLVKIGIETTGTKPTQIMLSENENFENAYWQAISDPITYKLSSSNGEKTVYAKVVVLNITESNVLSDSINLTTNDNATILSDTIPLEMSPGQKYKVSVTLQNTGASIWPQGWDFYRLGAVGDSDDLGGQGRYPMPKDVYPNDEVTIEYYLTAPTTTGTYTTDWRMVKEYEHWFGEKLVKQVIVKDGLKKNNSAYIVDYIPEEVSLKQPRLFIITFKNTGNATWTKTDLYKLGISGDRQQLGCPGRVELTNDVFPGEETTFNFWINPVQEGEYTITLRMLQENVEWFGDSISKTIKVVKYTGVDKKIFEIYE